MSLSYINENRMFNGSIKKDLLLEGICVDQTSPACSSFLKAALSAKDIQTYKVAARKMAPAGKDVLVTFPGYLHTMIG